MAESSACYSEMTSPPEKLESSKFVAPVEEKTIVGGISELVTGIKNSVPTLPSNCKLKEVKICTRVTVCLTITVHKN